MIKVIIIFQCFSPIATFLVAEQQILSQHKQCNNLALLDSKGIQLICRFGLKIASWLQKCNFYLSGTLIFHVAFFFWLPSKESSGKPR